MKILLIDDNQEITRPLSKFLTMKGHDCTVLNDGRNGLTLIEGNKFDVVILDLAMPKFSGFDVIDALEKSGKIKEQRIIVFSALSLEDDRIRKLEKKGVYACIKKPIQLPPLLKMIEGTRV